LGLGNSGMRKGTACDWPVPRQSFRVSGTVIQAQLFKKTGFFS